MNTVNKGFDNYVISIYVLFKVTISSSEYTALNVMMIGERWITKGAEIRVV
jgi:hypothetical protein